LKGYRLIVFFFFFIVEGEWVEFNVFFIVERLGRGSWVVIFFTNSLWDGGKGALRVLGVG
jgi:hypothetical protein